MLLTKLLCWLWEVPDHLDRDSAGYDVVVPMSLSPAKDGKIGPTLRSVVQPAALMIPGAAPCLMLVDSCVIMGVNLCDEMIAEATRLGVDRSRIIRDDPSNPRIHTYSQAEFSVRTVVLTGNSERRPRILVVANHLHMRRVLSAFRRVTGGDRTELFWMSVRDKGAYTRNVYQERFWHPLMFLVYEVAAPAFFKIKGWA